MAEFVWNPWHGCKKYSEGCENCYVYRRDGSVGRDASLVSRNADFSLPEAKNRSGGYKIPDGSTVWCCMTSDFFLKEADGWRNEAWAQIADRKDVSFVIITKRIARFAECLPADWGEGYDNVTVCCTCENQKRASERIPIFTSLPIKKRLLVCEPLLGEIVLPECTYGISGAVVGGESGPLARECKYEWVLSLREQCAERGMFFRFKQTGARFVKDGRLYAVPRRYQHSQAKKAGIDYFPEEEQR